MSSIALVTASRVENVAAADDPPEAEWLAAVQAQFDAVVDVTALDPRPSIGWSYDGSIFTPPPAPEEPLA